MSGSRRARAWARHLRVANLPSVLSNGLAVVALLGLQGRPAAWAPPVVALAAFYLAGMGLNDLLDQAWDRAHRPDRPLVDGSLGARWAWALCAALFGLGFSAQLAAPAPGDGLLGALALSGLIVAYDLLHKRSAAAPLLMGACRLGGVLMVGLALGGGLDVAVLGLGGVQLGYVLLLTVLARREARAGRAGQGSIVPLLLAGIGLVDGAYLMLVLSPLWGLLGVATALATWLAGRWVSGD